MPPEIAAFREEFRQLTDEYIRALRAQELAGLDAIGAVTGDALNAWIAKTNIADEINGRRLSVREDLLSAMRALT